MRKNDKIEALVRALKKAVREKYPAACTTCGGTGGEDVTHQKRPDGVQWVDCDRCLGADIHPLTGEAVKWQEGEDVEWVSSYYDGTMDALVKALHIASLLK